jgi:hypothetical protein
VGSAVLNKASNPLLFRRKKLARLGKLFRNPTFSLV